MPLLCVTIGDEEALIVVTGGLVTGSALLLNAFKPDGHCSLLVTDIAGFGRVHEQPVQQEMRSQLYRILEECFRECRIPPEECYGEDRGDGILVAVPERFEARLLVSPFVENLQLGLREYNRDVDEQDKRIQLRVALHVGAAHYDGRGLTGADVTLVFRVNNATKLKEGLREQGASVAFLVSNEVYRTVVKPARPPRPTLATAGWDNTTRLWDITDHHNSTSLASLTDHGGTVVAADRLASSPDGRTLATASPNEPVRLWDVTSLRRLKSLADFTGHTSDPGMAGQASTLGMLVFSSNGAILATAGDNTARLWDVTNPRFPQELTTLEYATDSAVYSVAFSPDRRTLATGVGSNDPAVNSGNPTVVLWDITDPRHPTDLTTLRHHTRAVSSVAISPNGHTLATASHDHTVRLWDITDPRHPKDLATLEGHTDAIYSVAFSPDGHSLATASRDRTARLWDVTDPRHPEDLATLEGHLHAVYSVVFGPDGHTLATGSQDGTARLWETDVDRVAARICAIAYPAITRPEWDRYFPDLAYQPPCPRR